MKEIGQFILIFIPSFCAGDLLPDTTIILTGVIWPDDTYRNIGASFTVVGTFPLLIDTRNYRKHRLYRVLAAIFIGNDIGIMLIWP